MVLCSGCRHPSTVQHCHDGNESGRVDLIPSSKIGCDVHRKNRLLAENRRYAAMNFGHKVRDAGEKDFLESVVDFKRGVG